MHEYQTIFVELHSHHLSHAEGVEPINDCLRLWGDMGWVFVSLEPLGYRPGVYVTFRRELAPEKA